MKRKTKDAYQTRAQPQQTLLVIPKDWEEEWQDMPEFVQSKQEPYCQLTVRFASEADLQDFAQRIGQKLTRLTKSIWHPEVERREYLNQGYRHDK
jgi:hypothetical protein